MNWIEGGPEEWTRRYVASQPLMRAVVVLMAMAFMPLLGRKGL